MASVLRIVGKHGRNPSKFGMPVVTTLPIMCRWTTWEAPQMQQNMNTMRPFSRRWAMVSIPLPVKSR